MQLWPSGVLLAEIALERIRVNFAPSGPLHRRHFGIVRRIVDRVPDPLIRPARFFHIVGNVEFIAELEGGALEDFPVAARVFAGPELDFTLADGFAHRLYGRSVRLVAFRS